jgi:hypothetical protein
MLPDTIKNQFDSGRIANWDNLKKLFYSINGCKVQEPPVMRLFAFLKSIPILAKSGIKESSIIQNLRDMTCKFLGVYNTPINSAEIEGENFGFIGRELFSPNLNLSMTLNTLCYLDYNTVEEIFTSMARKRDKTLDELSVKMILEGKKELYEKLNSKNRGKSELLIQTWDHAYRTHPNDAGNQYLKILTNANQAREEREKYKRSVVLNKISDNTLECDSEDFYQIESDGGTVQEVTINQFNSKFKRGNLKGKVFLSKKPFNRRSDHQNRKPDRNAPYPKNRSSDRQNRRVNSGNNFKDRVKNFKPKNGRFQVKHSKNDKTFFAFSEDQFEELKTVVLDYVSELENDDNLERMDSDGEENANKNDNDNLMTDDNDDRICSTLKLFS